MAAALAVLGSACATVHSVCPPGTRLGGASSPRGRARWCQSTARTIDAVPTPGRSFDGALGISRPTAARGGIEGPYTGWYPDGTLEMYGRYERHGSISVPHGVWGFWYPQGARRALGMYRDGLPVGCFATWDEDGRPRTAIVDGERLRPAACRPPPDDDILAIEGGGVPEAPPPVSWDLGMQGFAGPGGIGARNELQVDPDPDLAAALSLAARKRLGPVRAGATVSMRISGVQDYRAYAATGVVGIAIPRLPPRLDLELAAELGIQRIDVVAQQPVPQLPGLPGRAELHFWAPLMGAQLTLAYALAPLLEVTLAARLDGTRAHDAIRHVQYCLDLTCFPAERETWRVGGWVYGAAAGLRILLR